MALIPDKGKLCFSELNVDIPAGVKPKSAYDLALFHELGRTPRGVLVVTMIVSFKFKNGTSTKTPGAVLTWTPDGKTKFMDGFKAACSGLWGEKHRLTTTATVPAVNDVGVIFDIQTAEDMSTFSHSHWNATVVAVDNYPVSTTLGACVGIVTNGDVDLDSADLTPAPKGGPDPQRDAVHEFGHMLGYDDEYAAANANKNWLSDLKSIMNLSETIQPRHYVFFADWLTKQYGVAAALSKTSIVWKVNGTVDLTNAKV